MSSHRSSIEPEPSHAREKSNSVIGALASVLTATVAGRGPDLGAVPESRAGMALGSALVVVVASAAAGVETLVAVTLPGAASPLVNIVFLPEARKIPPPTRLSRACFTSLNEAVFVVAAGADVGAGGRAADGIVVFVLGCESAGDGARGLEDTGLRRSFFEGGWMIVEGSFAFGVAGNVAGGVLSGSTMVMGTRLRFGAARGEGVVGAFKDDGADLNA